MTDQEKRKLIAERIKEARRLAGLSQGQVAVMLGLHRPSVTEIEAGNRAVSAAELSKMAGIFEVSLSYLLGESPDTLSTNDPRLQLAARELSKLSPDALNSLMRALAAFQDADDASTGKAKKS